MPLPPGEVFDPHAQDRERRRRVCFSLLGWILALVQTTPFPVWRELGCTTSLTGRWELCSPGWAHDLPKVSLSSGKCVRLLEPPGCFGRTASNVPSQPLHSVPRGYVL